MFMLISLPSTWFGWLTLIGTALLVLGLIGAVGYTVFKLVKNGKLEELKEAVVKAIKEAEKTHQSGAEKKQIVVETVSKFCEEIGLKLDKRLLQWIADYIDRYIADHNELELIEEEEE